MTETATTDVVRTGLPPGPRGRAAVRELRDVWHNMLGLMDRMHAQYGDLACLSAGPFKLVMVYHPDDIERVLVQEGSKLEKGIAIRRARPWLGDSLMTKEAEEYLRQRRMVQPAFQPRRLGPYAEVMVRRTTIMCDSWHAGQEFDLEVESNQVMLSIVGETMFGADIYQDANDIAGAVEEARECFPAAMGVLGPIIQALRLPPTGKFRRAKHRVDATVQRMIDERRAIGDDMGDVLSILINARDVETDNTGMTEQELLDEVRLLLLTGRDTTTGTVTWALYELSQNPEVRERVEAEVDRVCGREHPPTLEQLDQLQYTLQTWYETLRKYPTATGLPRTVREPFDLGGYRMKPGFEIAVPVWTVQRDERWWPDPEKFDPDRFEPGWNKQRPRYSFCAFGGGRRICPGQAFANQAGVLMLATILQRWRLDLKPGAVIEPVSVFTLTAKDGMPMVVSARP